MALDTTGLLAGIARGLRAGAGVLSPEVFAQNERERQLKMLQSEQGKEKLFSLIAEGIQSGAIEPDKGMAALAKLNPQMAEQLGTMGMGPSVSAQQALLERQQALSDRAAVEQWARENNVPVPFAETAFEAQNSATANKPESTLGKLAEDYRAGRITKAEYEGARRKALYIAPSAADPIDRLYSAYQTAVQSGDTPRAEVLKRAIDLNTTRAPAQDGNDQRERKIQALQSQGLSRPDAENIVDRNLDIQINPATGRVVLTDLVTRRVTELPVGSGGERPAVAQGQTLYSMTGEGVTGLAPAIAETGSKVTGQVGGPVAEKVTQRRQALRTAQQDLIRALSVNSRFPVAEQERIREEIAINPSILDSDESLRARMRAIDQSLRIRLSQAERDANDPNLPEDLRSSQAQNAAAIRNFLDLLGVPAEEGGDDDALIQKWLGK